MTLGERIKALRTEKGISQEGLAEALDVTRQAVSKWETDGAIPDIDKMIGLCDLFDVSMDYLVRGKAAEEAPVQQRATGIRHLDKWKVIGAFCLAGGIYALPMLLQLAIPLFSWLPLIPLTLIPVGLLMILKPRHLLPVLWSVFGAVTVVYTITRRQDWLLLVRYTLARYPDLQFPGRENDVLQTAVQCGLLLCVLLGLGIWSWLKIRRSGGQIYGKRKWIPMAGTAAGLLGLAAAVVWKPYGTGTPYLVWWQAGVMVCFWLTVISLLLWLPYVRKRKE